MRLNSVDVPAPLIPSPASAEPITAVIARLTALSMQRRWEGGTLPSPPDIALARVFIDLTPSPVRAMLVISHGEHGLEATGSISSDGWPESTFVLAVNGSSPWRLADMVIEYLEGRLASGPRGEGPVGR